MRYTKVSIAISLFVLGAAGLVAIDHSWSDRRAMSPPHRREKSGLAHSGAEESEPAGTQGSALTTSLRRRMERPERFAVDPEKVRAELANFNRVLNSVTREDLEAEQLRMKAAHERMSHATVAEPEMEIEHDRYGLAWVKKTYPSGEVRYDFPSQ